MLPPNPTPHSPEAYAGTFRQATAEARRIATGLTGDQFNWKPSPNVWSVGECIEHLNIIGRAYVPAMDRVLSEKGTPGSPPFRYGWVGRLFIRACHPDTPRRMKTAPAMNPTAGGARSGLDREAVLAELVALNDGFLAVCEKAEGVDLTAVRMGSPFLRLMRLQVGVFLEGLSVHELRHLAQAERVTQHPGFPSA